MGTRVRSRQLDRFSNDQAVSRSSAIGGLPASNKWIEHRDAGWLEVPDVACNHGQTVLQCRGRDDQVRRFVPEVAGQTPPATCGGNVDVEHPVAVPREHAVQPDRQLPRKRWVGVLLLGMPRSISPTVTALRYRSGVRWAATGPLPDVVPVAAAPTTSVSSRNISGPADGQPVSRSSCGMSAQACQRGRVRLLQAAETLVLVHGQHDDRGPAPAGHPLWSAGEAASTRRKAILGCRGQSVMEATGPLPDVAPVLARLIG